MTKKIAVIATTPVWKKQIETTQKILEKIGTKDPNLLITHKTEIITPKNKNIEIPLKRIAQKKQWTINQTPDIFWIRYQQNTNITEESKQIINQTQTTIYLPTNQNINQDPIIKHIKERTKNKQHKIAFIITPKIETYCYKDQQLYKLQQNQWQPQK